MIPNEAVEAAVEAHCEGTMRAALEAAAPYILAGAETPTHTGATRVSKWKVSKNESWPGTYPWEVDGPDGELSDVFETWTEAIEHVRSKS